MPENANSVMLVAPMVTSPAAAGAASKGAPRAADGSDLRTTDPAVVALPSTSNRSFQAAGTPSSGLKGRPALRRAPAAAASRRARAAKTSIKIALSPCELMAASVRSVSSTAWSRPVRKSAPSAAAVLGTEIAAAAIVMIPLSGQIGHGGKTDGVRPFASKTMSRRSIPDRNIERKVVRSEMARLGQHAIADRTYDNRNLRQATHHDVRRNLSNAAVRPEDWIWQTAGVAGCRLRQWLRRSTTVGRGQRTGRDRGHGCTVGFFPRTEASGHFHPLRFRGGRY